MKNLKLILPILFLAFASLMMSCDDGSGSADKAQETQVSKDGPEYTAAYICPMNCKGSGSDKMGICPVCEMDYVANKKAKKTDGHEGHNHDGHDHSGHDHSHDGHSH